MDELQTPRIGGVELALLTSRLEGIARNMMNTLVRSARSGVINSGRDGSCVILTAAGELLAMAESIPIHVMKGADLMAQSMLALHPQIKRGDAFLHNSPYHGNSHAADHSILIPIIDENGVHRYTVLTKAHAADCGNSQPTTYRATARDLYEEGAPIFPCVRIQQNYADVADIIRMCEMRIRVPEQWHGDYLALLGAARIGERQILQLGAELGWETLGKYELEWFSYSEARMVEAIGKLPAGRAEVETCCDPFPGFPEGIPIKVAVEVRPKDGIVEVDLRDNPDCQPCGLNLSEATATTAAMIGVFNSLNASVPLNAGSYRRIEVHLRQNCVVGIPSHPVSCSVATTNLADRVANATQRGFALLGDGQGMAEGGLIIPAAWAVLSGVDPRTGVRFVNQLMGPCVTGGAASPLADGWLLMGHSGNAGMAYRDSVEVAELHQPIRIVAQHIIADSEGAGRFRGAPGAYCEYGPVGCAVEANWVSDGAINPAEGVRGGLRGGAAQQYKRNRLGDLVEMPAWGGVNIEDGETIVSISCGGGGYGPPVEREARLVGQDVRENWISAARARSIYHVEVDDSGQVNEDATWRLRNPSVLSETRAE